MTEGNKPNATSDALPARAVAALEQGNKLEAIKIVRIEHDLQLKDAKAVVDRYVQPRPELASRLMQLQAGAQRRAVTWLIAVLLVIVAVWYVARQSQ